MLEGAKKKKNLWKKEFLKYALCPESFKEMKSLTGLSCPNKWCSKKAGSPELAASGIWFAELTQPKGNKSCHVASEQGNVWSVVLTEVTLQPARLGRVPVSQDVWLFLGSLTQQCCCNFSAWLWILRVLPGTNSRFMHWSQSFTHWDKSKLPSLLKFSKRKKKKGNLPHCCWIWLSHAGFSHLWQNWKAISNLFSKYCGAACVLDKSTGVSEKWRGGWLGGEKTWNVLEQVSGAWQSSRGDVSSV